MWHREWVVSSRNVLCPIWNESCHAGNESCHAWNESYHIGNESCPIGNESCPMWNESYRIGNVSCHIMEWTKYMVDMQCCARTYVHEVNSCMQTNIWIRIYVLRTYSYWFWRVISSISSLNQFFSSLGLFCHVPFKRDKLDWNWRIRLNDTPHAMGCICTHNVNTNSYVCINTCILPMHVYILECACLYVIYVVGTDKSNDFDHFAK